MASFNSRLKFRVIVLLFQLVLLELTCAGFLLFYFYPARSEIFYYDYSDYLDNIPEEHVENFERNDPASVYWFDPVLGWNTGPLLNGLNSSGCQGKPWSYSTDELGSRSGPYSDKTALISSYGGSYTFGAEVDDHQTWSYFLSVLTGAKVYNFGVGAYGPDQALLKMERNFEKGIRTPIVALGLYSAGISRTVNTYRPFLSPDAGLKLGFKPRLTDKNGHYEWLDTPLTSLADHKFIQAAFEVAKKDDYWYAANERKPHMGFPYTVTMARLAYYLLFEYEPKKSLWNTDHIAARNMFEIVRRFVELGKQDDFVPVLVMLPELGELQGYADAKPPYYGEFLEVIQENYDPAELILVDVYQEKFDPSEFSRPGCHPSEYGHRIIANSVYGKIVHVIDSLEP